MQYASAAYRQEMKEDLRNPSYVWVYLGVVNQKAQSIATVTATQAEYSDPSRVTDSTAQFEGYYATMEQDQFRLDGNIFFQPDTGPFALYQGVVTENTLQPIRFVFGGLREISIKGLTIDFGDYYPTEFDVTNGETTHTYAPEGPGKFVLDDTYNNCSYITITPRSMVGGVQRFRILSILFGVGLQFTNKDIISTSRTNTVDHISSQLPQKQFTFTVDNTKLKLNKDNPESYANYLEEKQECTFEYGRELLDGTIERIPGGKTLLKTWSSNDLQARFTTVGRLDYMTDKYYKGQYYELGITAYDLATLVLQDAGITDYILDVEMQNVIIYNPLPIDTHKACLQIIANVCRGILYDDREGRITIRTSVLPQVSNTAQSANVEAYSVSRNTVSSSMVYDYATFENNYFRLDGTQYFITENPSSYLPCGFVSVPADANGEFGQSDPYIDLEFSNTVTVNGLTLQFGDAIPQELTITEYKNNVPGSTITVTDMSTSTSVTQIFIDVDKLRITFTKVLPLQRIHLNKVALSGALNYEIGYHDLKESPIATGIERVSSVNVHMFQYSKGTTEEVLLSADAVAGDNTFVLTDDAHDLSAEYKDGRAATITIVESGAHYIVINAPAEGEILIKGTKYLIVENIYTNVMHESGSEKELRNELISNRTVARNVAIWLSEFFDNDVEYDVTYRGDPTLDCDDIIYLENKYVERNLIRVTSETLNTSTGISLSCKVKGRRLSFADKRSVVGLAVVGTAIVGRSAAS